jgi:hypothetical protein
VTVEEARQVLDAFGVPERLQHIRRFVWRDGTLRFFADASRAFYELQAERNVSTLEAIGGTKPGLQPVAQPVVEGRWVQHKTSESVRVGIELSVPSAIFLRARGLNSFVPYAGRLQSDVEHALQTDLNAYVSRFLSNG